MPSDPTESLLATALILGQGLTADTQRLLTDALIRHAKIESHSVTARNRLLRLAAQRLLDATEDAEVTRA